MLHHVCLKPLKEIDTRPPENVVKGAVKLDPSINRYLDEKIDISGEADVIWTYVTIDKQNEVLNDLITRLSVELKLPQSDTNIYALKFEDCENEGVFLANEYREVLRQGFLLILTASPERYALSLLSGLDESTHRSTLADLISVCGDAAFAAEFHRIGGIELLLASIERGSYSDDLATQSQQLQALLMLMEHPIYSWANVSDSFVAKIAENITGRVKQEDNTLLLSSLSMIDLILNSKSESRVVVVLSEVPFESLIRHLEKSNERIILNVLTLMISLYYKADVYEQSVIVKHLHGKPFRHAIEKSVLRKCILDVEIEQHLVTVQRILLDKLAEKALQHTSDSEIEGISQLRLLSGSIGRSGTAESLVDWACFRNLPPGRLAVELIFALVTYHPEWLTKMNFENSMRYNSWSFPIVAFNVINMLIDVFHLLGEPKEGDRLYVILFKSEHPFVDLLAVMLRLFRRTWYEMNASDEDINKVFAVVRKQIEICMCERPETIEKLEELLIKHSYSFIQKLWDGERSAKEAEELQSDSIKELRQYLKPSIVNLVKKNRKNALKMGQTFGKLSKSKSLQKGTQFWHWKLDPNENTFFYSDCSLTDRPIQTDRSSLVKVPVSEIRRVVSTSSGNSLLASPKGKKNAAAVRGLMIEVGDKPDTYYLVTSDEQVIDTWADGFNALIGIDQLSVPAERRVDRFLDIELKMRLLHLDKISNSFEMPKLPANFDWISVKMLI